MASTDYSTDYTPNDFLQKLLGKSSSTIQTSNEDVKKTSNYGHHSAVEVSPYTRITSPKNTSIKRIYLQSVGNIPNLVTDKQNEQKSMNQENKCSEFKEIPTRSPIKRLSIEKKLNQNNNPQTNSLKNVQSKNSITSSLKQSSELHQKNLILKKAQLFLKSSLNGKLPELEIQKILNQIETGFSNPYQFDNLICSSSQNIQPKQIQKKQVQIPIKIKQYRSKSFDGIQLVQKVHTRKYKSQEKHKSNKVLSKKAKKQEMNLIRQQMLKTIKKIKNLVFVNEKSLKLTRKISIQ